MYNTVFTKNIKFYRRLPIVLIGNDKLNKVGTYRIFIVWLPVGPLELLNRFILSFSWTFLKWLIIHVDIAGKNSDLFNGGSEYRILKNKICI